MRNLARILQEKFVRKLSYNIFLQDSSGFLQDFLYLARKASLLVQDLQDFVQDLAREILARFGYFLQDGFYWVILHQDYINHKNSDPICENLTQNNILKSSP